MQQPARRRLGQIAEWALLCVLVTVAGLVSKLYTRGAGGVSTIWLANGLTVGYLLYASRERWGRLILASVAGQLLSGVLVHDTTSFVLLAALFNSIEVLVAALTLRTGITSARELSRPANFLRFLGYAVLAAPLISSAVLSAYLFAGVGRVSPRVLEGWAVGHALGMATVVPVTLALCGNELARLFRRGHMIELIGGLLLIVLTTTAVFWQSQYPLLFLIFPTVMLAALRAGFAGTAFALIVVIAISATLTGLGHGPLMLSATTSYFNNYLVLQTFMAVLLLTCFPVAVGMSALRYRQNTEHKLRNRLRLLADHASDIIVLTDMNGRRLYVSPSVQEVLGQKPEDFLRSTFRDLVAPEHVDSLQQLQQQLSLQENGKATITFPSRRVDGSRLWLEARVKHFRDSDFMLFDDEQLQQAGVNLGRSGEEGFIVTLRDITRRHQAEQELESVNRKLASLAWEDGLTGLGNRRRFDQMLAQGWESCRLAGLPLSVIMADVDHFKRYNDQYGHQEGDHCLAEVAGALSGCLRRERDCAARYGGEEFALILPGVSVDAASEIAERIRESIERLSLPHVGSPLGHITVSLGVASCVPTTDERPEDLVSAADRALYASKKQGRNRVSSGVGLTIG
ncbi:MAG: diguanylate cyclase [Pseudomonadota bacterium]